MHKLRQAIHWVDKHCQTFGLQLHENCWQDLSEIAQSCHTGCEVKKEQMMLAIDTVWQVKCCQISIKLPKNYFTRKMKDFDTFTKYA